MSFDRVRFGGWSFGEVLTSDQMNTLDIDHTFSLDGSSSSGGGTYTPAARLIWRNAWTFDGDNVPVDGLETMVVVTGNTNFNSGSDANPGLSIIGHSNLGSGDAGNAIQVTGGDSNTGAGGVGASITGGASSNNLGGTGVVAVGGTGDIGGIGITGTAGLGTTPQGLPGVLGSGEPDDGTSPLGGGAGVIGGGGDQSGLLNSDVGGQGLIGSGGEATAGVGTGGIGVQGTGGVSLGGTGGRGVQVVGGLGIVGGTGTFTVGGNSVTGTPGFGIIAAGGSATTSGTGGTGAILSGGSTASGTGGTGGIITGGTSATIGGIGLTAQGGSGGTIDGVGISVLATNETGIIARTDGTGFVTAGLFIHEASGALPTRAALTGRSTSGASALRLEADGAGNDDGAHIYFEDSVTDVGQSWSNGHARFKNGPLVTAPITAFSDLVTTTLISRNGLVININGIEYGFVMHPIA